MQNKDGDLWDLMLSVSLKPLEAAKLITLLEEKLDELRKKVETLEIQIEDLKKEKQKGKENASIRGLQSIRNKLHD